MSFQEHEVIVKITDEATKGLKQIEGTTDNLMQKIEKNREGIQAIGISA
jgi:hypothetical protein